MKCKLCGRNMNKILIDKKENKYGYVCPHCKEGGSPRYVRRNKRS